MQEAIRTELKKTYLFHDFSNEELNKIAFFIHKETLNPGDLLLAEGTRADSLYIVHYGSIRRHIGTSEFGLGMEYSTFLGSGGIIGETGMVAEEPIPLQMEVLEHTELLRIPFLELNFFLKEHPEAALKFYQAIGRHLSHLVHHLIQEMTQIREAHFQEKHEHLHKAS